MAGPPLRRFRRMSLAFVGALAAHVWLFHQAATQVFRTKALTASYETPLAPVAFVPPPKPAKPVARRAPRKAQRIRLAPREAPIVADPLTVASGGPVLSGEADALAPPLPPLANGGGAAASGEAPADLTRQAPEAHYPINPGYWEVDERWPLFSRRERYCLEPWNIVRFMLAPCNHIYHCVYPVQTIGPDTFHFQGVITGSKDRFDVRGGGDYTPTSLHLSVTGLGHWHILPVIFSASLDGRYLGSDCPADAKRIRQR